ncbi:MAG: ribosome maturation factor RimM [Nannocystaceae bacterium]
MAATSPTLAVAEIVGVHGVRGALRVRLHDPESEALEVGRTVLLGDGGPPAKILECSRVPHTDLVRLRVDTITTRDDAEGLRGRELHVDRELLPPLADDEFYLADAIGLPVLRRRDDDDDDAALEPVGEIVGLTDNTVQDLFEIEWTDPASGQVHEWLLPVLPQFIESIDDDRLIVRLPIGLLPAALEPEEPAEPGPA